MRPFLIALGLTAAFAIYFVEYDERVDPENRVCKHDPKQRAREKALLAKLNGHDFQTRDGANEAKADIAAGRPRFMICGKEFLGIEEQKKIFEDRFSVSVEVLAGCATPAPVSRYSDDYNAVVLGYLHKRFGESAYRNAMDDALALARAKRAP